jgi:hypothetical protein
MNIADSMKNVLKHKTHIFTENWKDDLSLILKEVGDDMSDLVKSGKASFKNLKGQHIKTTFRDVKDSASDTLVIFKVLPKRIKVGFHFFKEDFLEELERRKEHKEKTIFSMKVIGTLTTFTVGTVYNVRKGNMDFRINGLRRVNTFSRFLIGELVFKITRVLLLRFLNEVEKGVSEGEDVTNIRYFKGLLISRDNDEEDHIEPGDPAIEIVENLKKYIMTGKRGIE